MEMEPNEMCVLACGRPADPDIPFNLDGLCGECYGMFVRLREEKKERERVDIEARQTAWYKSAKEA